MSQPTQKTITCRCCGADWHTPDHTVITVVCDRCFPARYTPPQREHQDEFLALSAPVHSV